MKSLKLIFLIISFLISSPTFSKTYKILTVNSKDGRSMTFDPMFIKLEVGDTLKFIHPDKGHTSESLLTPGHVNSWKGKNDDEVEVKLKEEGIYIYQCQNHGVMGMIGAVQVGRAINLDEAKAFLEKHRPNIALRKERIDELLGQLTESSQN